MGFSLRVVGILFLTLAFSLGFTASLIHPKFVKAFSFVNAERHQILAHGLEDTIETGVNVGLPLEEMQNLQSLLTEATARDPTILSVAIYDTEGQTLFSQGSVPAGAPKLAAGTAMPPEEMLPDATRLTVPIRNSFDRIVGSLVLRFSRARADVVPHAAFLLLLRDSLLVLAICAIPAGITCFLLFRPILRQVSMIETVIGAAADEAAADAPLTHDRALVAGFRQVIRSVSHDLETLETTSS